MKTTKKPTLLSLRLQTTITTQEVAQKAGVSLTQAYVVEIGGFTDRESAKKVVLAFSALSGTHYTLDDIRFQNVSTSAVPSTRISDLETSELPIPPQKK